MPTNKNAMTRYKILDDLLSNRHHFYTLDDIVERINDELAEMGIEPVSRRCVEKDIAYLKGEQSPFFADIESFSETVYSGGKTVKKRCVRYSDPAFSIFKKQLSDDEAYLLSQALSLLGSFDGLPGYDELQKLQAPGGKRDDRRIVAFDKAPSQNSNLFGKLFTAISQKQAVRLTYHALASAEAKKSLILHPCLLKEYNRRWYVFGAADEDGKLLHFSLDQIDGIEELPAQPYKPCAEGLKDFFDDIIGVTHYDGCEAEEIVLWVGDGSKNYVATKPLHRSQKSLAAEDCEKLRGLYPSLQGGAFFTIRCIENYELIRELSSYGADLAVLSPKRIQDKIFEQISAMSAKYSKLRT